MAINIRVKKIDLKLLDYAIDEYRTKGYEPMYIGMSKETICDLFSVFAYTESSGTIKTNDKFQYKGINITENNSLGYGEVEIL